MKKLVILLCLIVPVTAYAAPVINSVTDSSDAGTTWSHKESIIISGSEFGTKSPAAPFVWDDCEDKTVESNAAVLSEGGYNEARPNASNVPEDYRISYRTAPKRSTAAPHSHSTKYLAGGHYQTTDHAGRDCLITADTGSQYANWFVSFYHRLDPAYPACGTDCANYKTCDRSHTDVAWSTDDYEQIYVGYGDLCSKECGTNAKVCVYSDPTEHLGATTLYDKTTGNCHDNPKYGWVRVEERIGLSLGFLYIYGNNELAYGWSGATDLTKTLQSYSVGGFYRYNGCRSDYLTHNDAWRYFDDIYIDTTLSRVMLCNSATYPTSNSSICEPQIPTAWSDTSITIDANLGALGSSPAYVYVFDGSNVSGRYSGAVMLSTGGGCTSDSECDDINPCTDDDCTVDSVCVNYNNTADCDDALWCNGTDTCSSGSCTHQYPTDNRCSGATPICNETTNACVACSGVSDCEDNNDCTTNTCSAGSCSYPAVSNGTVCDDGAWCTLTDTCQSGICTGTGDPCSAGYSCNDMEQTCDMSWIMLGVRYVGVSFNVGTGTTSISTTTTSAASTTTSAATTTTSSAETTTVASTSTTSIFGDYTPVECILGPGDGAPGTDFVNNDNVACDIDLDPDCDTHSTGQNPDFRYKAFRWRYIQSIEKEGYLFGLIVTQMNTPASVTSVDLQYAVYNDNAGAIGSLKMYGNTLDYDFTDIGIGRHYFDIDNVASGQNRIFTPNAYYWIMFRSNIGESNYMMYSRFGNPHGPTNVIPICPDLAAEEAGCPSGYMKMADTITSETPYNTAPPNPLPVDMKYMDDYWGWEIWSAE